jgi:DNA-binding transcriptional ArsR family regulator
MMARLVTILGMAWLEAIADPIRLGIVRELSRRPDASLNELAHAVTAAPETIRRHVRQLERAGVVTALPRMPDGESRGRPPVRYRLASPPDREARALSLLTGTPPA